MQTISLKTHSETVGFCLTTRYAEDDTECVARRLIYVNVRSPKRRASLHKTGFVVALVKWGFLLRNADEHLFVLTVCVSTLS